MRLGIGTSTTSYCAAHDGRELVLVVHVRPPAVLRVPDRALCCAPLYGDGNLGGVDARAGLDRGEATGSL